MSGCRATFTIWTLEDTDIGKRIQLQITKRSYSHSTTYTSSDTCHAALDPGDTALSRAASWESAASFTMVPLRWLWLLGSRPLAPWWLCVFKPLPEYKEDLAYDIIIKRSVITFEFQLLWKAATFHSTVHSNALLTCKSPGRPSSRAKRGWLPLKKVDQYVSTKNRIEQVF